MVVSKMGEATTTSTEEAWNNLDDNVSTKALE
jgi:hypothetical protein